jgi:hypothetical protein
MAPAIVAAANHGISAGPVVAFLAIVAAAIIILVVAVSYIVHHRALNANAISASQPAAQWATQFGSNPSLSSEPGKDEFSR